MFYEIVSFLGLMEIYSVCVKFLLYDSLAILMTAGNVFSDWWVRAFRPVRTHLEIDVSAKVPIVWRRPTLVENPQTHFTFLLRPGSAKPKYAIVAFLVKAAKTVNISQQSQKWDLVYPGEQGLIVIEWKPKLFQKREFFCTYGAAQGHQYTKSFGPGLLPLLVSPVRCKSFRWLQQPAHIWGLSGIYYILWGGFRIFWLCFTN